MPEVGEVAPDFSLAAVPDSVSLRVLLKRGAVVLLFYTEDATPLCTRELQPFVADHEALAELGASIVAISSDDLDSHRRFLTRLGAPFALASDPDLAIARAYGVADEEAKRARRAVFIVGRDGKLVHANRDYNATSATEYEAVANALADA
jgi:thioredoxin-dependent peroxiredoxin